MFKTKLAVIYYCMFFTFAIGQTLERPKLIVGIVVDQMRYDYIYRYWEKYTDKGFKRFIKEGFFFENTHHNFVPTYTAPGHAAIYTGATPSQTGIVANDWYVREKNKTVYCVKDTTYKTIGADNQSGQCSPLNLKTSTIADELKLATNFRSKTIGIALKDRSAILPVGFTADAAYWFDSKTNRWVSSSYYMDSLPKHITEFNAKITQKYHNKSWETLLPISNYTESTIDDSKSEKIFKHEEKPIFPHKIQDIRVSPLGNTITKDLAKWIIEKDSLGKDIFTDVLAISFSSTDYIGHQFGTQSIEIQDTYLRLDKEIAELIEFIDQQVGLNNTLLFLTADHGAAHPIQFMNEHKLPAYQFDEEDMLNELKNMLEEQFGNKNFISHYINQQIYLNHSIIKKQGRNLKDVKLAIEEFLLQQKGVQNVIDLKEILNKAATNNFETLIKNGIYPTLSGDIFIQLTPFSTEYTHYGSTHGSCFSYDTHVPLLLLGYKIKQGKSSDYMPIKELAATIAQILKIEFPNGYVATEKSGKMYFQAVKE